MQINLVDGITNALTISKNLLSKWELSEAQERQLQMSLCLIALSRRFFDLRQDKTGLEVLKQWNIQNRDILNIYLTDNAGKHYLYASYASIDTKDVGFYVLPEEVDRLAQLNEIEILAYWNKTMFNLGDTERLFSAA